MDNNKPPDHWQKFVEDSKNKLKVNENIDQQLGRTKDNKLNSASTSTSKNNDPYRANEILEEGKKSPSRFLNRTNMKTTPSPNIGGKGFGGGGGMIISPKNRFQGGKEMPKSYFDIYSQNTPNSNALAGEPNEDKVATIAALKGDSVQEGAKDNLDVPQEEKENWFVAFQDVNSPEQRENMVEPDEPADKNAYFETMQDLASNQNQDFNSMEIDQENKDKLFFAFQDVNSPPQEDYSESAEESRSAFLEAYNDLEINVNMDSDAFEIDQDNKEDFLVAMNDFDQYDEISDENGAEKEDYFSIDKTATEDFTADEVNNDIDMGDIGSGDDEGIGMDFDI